MKRPAKICIPSVLKPSCAFVPGLFKAVAIMMRMRMSMSRSMSAMMTRRRRIMMWPMMMTRVMINMMR